MKWLVVVLLMLSSVAAWSQTAAQQDYDPDTVRTLYFDTSGPRPYPPSDKFPYKGVAVRTQIEATGVYEDRLVDISSQQLLLGVRHEPALGKALLIMFYPGGRPRVKAHFLEDTTGAPPTEYLVPSLKRPLSAHALLDGEVTTFYPNGQVRQRALYRRGQRVQSQCFDFRNRSVACNDNLLLMPAKLPAAVYTNRPVLCWVPASGTVGPKSIKLEVKFDVNARGEMLRLRVPLNTKQVDAETTALAQQHGQVPIDFVLDAQATSVTGTHSGSGALNQYLRGLALNTGELFWKKGAMHPALLDGELVTTYFMLPIQFELK